MLVNLKFENSPHLTINSVSVIGSFNGFNPRQNIMMLSDGYWQASIDFPPGEHGYKYLINGKIKLNDPEAIMYLPDENDELWSMIIINKNNQRLYNNEQYTVNIKEYAISNKMTNSYIVYNKKRFDKTVDQQAVVRFGFNHITGLHAVTAAWYDPCGRIYQVSENSLFSDENSLKQTVFLWFWIDLNESGNECPDGVYKFKLFIDGKFILEDEITIMTAITYSSRGYFNMYT